MDVNGCIVLVEVILIEFEGLNVVLSVIDFFCFGDEVGVVSVDVVEGGVILYVYGIDGFLMLGSLLFINLIIGLYFVQVQDVNGCIDL